MTAVWVVLAMLGMLPFVVLLGFFLMQSGGSSGVHGQGKAPKYPPPPAAGGRQGCD